MTTRWWVQPGETIWRDVEQHALYREEHELARVTFLWDDGTGWGLRVTRGDQDGDSLFWDPQTESFQAAQGGEVPAGASYAPVATVNPELAGLDTLIDEMIQQDPDCRPDARDVLARLEELVARVGTVSAEP